jgi:hypothetical protein
MRAGVIWLGHDLVWYSVRAAMRLGVVIAYGIFVGSFIMLGMSLAR